VAGKDTHVTRDSGNVDLGDSDVLVDGLETRISTLVFRGLTTWIGWNKEAENNHV